MPVEWLWQDRDALPLDDRGLAYGDGLFETVAVTPQGLVLWDAHAQRLLDGCARLGIGLSGAQLNDWWRAIERRWIHDRGPSGHVIKLIVTRGSGGRGYRPPLHSDVRLIASIHPLPAAPQAGVAAQLCRTRLVPEELAGAKTLNRLPQVQAARELRQDSFEGLMLNAQGFVTEGTRTNILFCVDGALMTPPSRDLAVCGVLRDWLLREGGTRGIPVQEGRLAPSRLPACEGLALVSSVLGIVPVHKVDCLRLPSNARIAKIQSLVQSHFGFPSLD